MHNDVSIKQNSNIPDAFDLGIPTNFFFSFIYYIYFIVIQQKELTDTTALPITWHVHDYDKINNILIERVSEFNFLGITFNSNLKWHAHINYITKKITGIVGLLWRLKDLYPMTVLRMLYNSLILPHLSYGILTWGAKISRDDKLHLIQKRCLRLISNSSYIAHTEPIYKYLRIISLPDMYSVAMWKFYYKLMNNILPSYFENILIYFSYVG